MVQYWIRISSNQRPLKYLESKYAIEIKRYNAVKPVPLVSKEYGQPFISKNVSERIARLQKHNFDFVNDGKLPYKTLIKKFPKCTSGIKWWCNVSEAKKVRIMIILCFRMVNINLCFLLIELLG